MESTSTPRAYEITKLHGLGEGEGYWPPWSSARMPSSEQTKTGGTFPTSVIRPLSYNAGSNFTSQISLSATIGNSRADLPILGMAPARGMSSCCRLISHATTLPAEPPALHWNICLSQKVFHCSSHRYSDKRADHQLQSLVLYYKETLLCSNNACILMIMIEGITFALSFYRMRDYHVCYHFSVIHIQHTYEK